MTIKNGSGRQANRRLHVERRTPGRTPVGLAEKSTGYFGPVKAVYTSENIGKSAGTRGMLKADVTCSKLGPSGLDVTTWLDTSPQTSRGYPLTTCSLHVRGEDRTWSRPRHGVSKG